MTDFLSPAERSDRMSRIRSKDTQPELALRKVLHRLGLRYRLHGAGLPGKPDLVFPRYKTVVFVHGCFWHQHDCAMGNRMPKSRIEFWREKLQGNKKRDAQNRRQLKAEGWSVLVIWECQTASTKMDRLRARVARFLDGQG